MTRAEALNAALPQTQCTRCGYPDCLSYAQAMDAGTAPINRCPPGGAEGVARLAALTGQPVQPLDAECGAEAPLRLALIDEDWCIGCTLCLDECPVDAIVGAHKRLHTVITEHCTGCELCLPVCPVDCIAMLPAHPESSPAPTGWQAWSAAQADAARQRYQRHQTRMARREDEVTQRQIERAEHKLADIGAASRLTDADALERKRAVVQAALDRARARLGKTPAA